MARGYADALIGASPFPQRSGLVLAAPRRTGKSTFLRRDLQPELARRRAVTAYVDLWSDRSRDPALLIVAAVAAAMNALQGPAARALRRIGVRRVSIAGFAVELDGRGGAEATLSDALTALARAADAPVVLIIDEAQAALASDAGVTAMFAVKAARDSIQLEHGNATGFGLVLTGSNRDKLADLVQSREQPFFGASVTDFPLLDRNYVEAYVAWLNERLASDNQIQADAAWRAFELLGRRPELLQEVLREIALGARGSGGLHLAITARAGELRRRLWRQYETDCDGLGALPMAVLRLVATEGSRLSPFSVETRQKLASAIGAETVPNSSVQNALATLRDRGLVWRSARGDYALEDQGL
ncbi:MAG: hypothetical protein EA356_00600, partial [Geminicoccaceae bacterium]